MKMIRTPAIWLAVLLLSASAPFAATAGPVAKGTGWTGYTATGKTFTRISGKWRQPTVQCTLSDARVSIWVGFGGDETL